MKTILNVLKYLLGFVVALIGFFAADSYGARLGLVGPTKIMLWVVGALPGLALLWLLDGKLKDNLQTVLRPVSTRVWVWRILGASIVLIGLFLILGNRSGLFTAFPFAGTLMLIAGAVVFAVKGS